MSNEFEARPAVRAETPVLVGLVGPSSTGKTFSALRIAAGFHRVSGGETFFIDTEAKRALHYADKFQFQHVEFRAPFGPLRYLAAIEYCMKRAAPSKKRPTIIVDSMSHEHEGEGGVLDMHESELERRAGSDWEKRARVTMLCWAKPKAERQRLIGSILQMDANFIFCFRAKPKLKLEKGKEPEQLGYQPISGDNFIYEMTLKCLLLPGANGVPSWQSDMIGERAMMKLPEQFRALFAKNPAPQLSEDIGEQLARWGAGSGAAKSVATIKPEQLIAEYEKCEQPERMRALELLRKEMWSSLDNDAKAAVKTAKEAADKRLAGETKKAS